MSTFVIVAQSMLFGWVVGKANFYHTWFSLGLIVLNPVLVVLYSSFDKGGK